jgi:hypothetical protein
MNTHDIGPVDESRRSCAMRKVDRLQIWSDALKASGMSHRSIDSKLLLAMELFRRMKYRG